MTRKKRTSKFEGLPLVDADEDVILHVTKNDVRISKIKDPTACAAANAGKRELKTDVRVFLSRMYVKDKKNKRWVRFLTPTNAAREIVSFDRGSSFEPGEYTFKAATTGQKLNYRAPTENHTNTGTHPRRKMHRTENVRISAKDYEQIK